MLTRVSHHLTDPSNLDYVHQPIRKCKLFYYLGIELRPLHGLAGHCVVVIYLSYKLQLQPPFDNTRYSGLSVGHEYI